MGRRSDGDDPLSAAAPALSIDDFAAWVGSEFRIGDGALRLPMTLSAAEPPDGSPPKAVGQPSKRLIGINRTFIIADPA